MIPTLHDENFSQYRQSSDKAFLNVGNMIFSYLGSLFLFSLYTTSFFFSCFYPPTQGKVAATVAVIAALVRACDFLLFTIYAELFYQIVFS